MKQLSGLETVLKNLNAEIKQIEGRTLKGLIRASLIVQGEGMRQTPRDTGNLVNSWYVNVVGGETQAGKSPLFVGKDAAEFAERHRQVLAESAASKSNNPVLEIGLTANYAAYVHEMVGSLEDGGAYAHIRGPKGKAKFLEDPIKENFDRIIGIVRDEAQIK